MAGSLVANEDTTAAGTLLAADVDSPNLTYSIVASPSASQGIVTITNSSTGAYSFTPAPNYNGPASFTFKVNDGILNSNIATVSITVAPVNDAPVAMNGTLTTACRITATGTLVASDIDNSNLAYSIVAPPTAAQGTVAFTNAAT